jgi:RNA polymerase sigma-70 factor (ECF subfamily)
VGCDGTRNDFDRLVAAEIPAVLRFAVRLTGDVDSAEEVVQETLFRAARSRASFRGESSLRTWLLKIAIHAFRDSVANRNRRPTEPIVDDLADPRGPEPDRASLQAELGEQIAQAVSSLPPRQREVLVLSVYEQLAAAEIAELLGITVSNVHVNLHHARERLKQLLAGYLAEK